MKRRGDERRLFTPARRTMYVDDDMRCTRSMTPARPCACRQLFVAYSYFFLILRLCRQLVSRLSLCPRTGYGTVCLSETCIAISGHT